MIYCQLKVKQFGTCYKFRRIVILIIKYIGHVERMEGELERLVKKIYRAEVEGNRGRGRPKRRWMDGVKGCLSDRGLTIPEAKECVKDR